MGENSEPISHTSGNKYLAEKKNSNLSNVSNVSILSNLKQTSRRLCSWYLRWWSMLKHRNLIIIFLFPSSGIACNLETSKARQISQMSGSSCGRTRCTPPRKIFRFLKIFSSCLLNVLTSPYNLISPTTLSKLFGITFKKPTHCGFK